MKRNDPDVRGKTQNKTIPGRVKKEATKKTEPVNGPEKKKVLGGERNKKKLAKNMRGGAAQGGRRDQ